MPGKPLTPDEITALATRSGLVVDAERLAALVAAAPVADAILAAVWRRARGPEVESALTFAADEARR